VPDASSSAIARALARMWIVIESAQKGIDALVVVERTHAFEDIDRREVVLA
jgi:hypothetical protein